jgi:hypothetical protein
MDRCRIDLNANAVLGGGDEVGNAQDMFQVAKDNFDLPSQAIQVNDQRQRIGLPIQQARDIPMPPFRATIPLSDQLHIVAHLGGDGWRYSS